MSPAPPKDNSGTMHIAGPCALLFVAVVMAFWPALNNSYVNYDDPDYLINNSIVQGGINLANVKWAFTTTIMSNWHPLTWLSHMLDCQIFGPRLWGHHLTSVLLHGLNAVLVFLVFRQSTGSFWRSLLLAACFGLHPLRVESVAWLSERKDVLSGFFGLAALLAYLCYCQKSLLAKNGPTAPSPSGPLATLLSNPASFYVLTLILLALSLLSKPTMVTLPCVMLLLDLWPLKRISLSNWWPALREKISFFALSAAMCVVTFLVQRSGGAMQEMSNYGMSHHVANAMVSYVRYSENFFWPAQLAPIYPVIEHWSTWVVAGAVLLIICITATFLWLRLKAPYAFVGWFWFLGTMVPMIGLVAVGDQAMADRYTYFTQLGLALLVIWGFEALTRSLPNRVPITAAASTGILLACIVATRQQTKRWFNSETIFRHTVAVTKDNYSAYANLSQTLEEQDRPEEALVYAREAAHIRPDSPETVCNLGGALARMGRLDEAIAAFREALRLRPLFADAHRNLAIALTQRGQLSEALEHYAESARISPDRPDRLHDYGIALAKAGRIDEAILQFEAALRLEPRYAIAHRNLAQALNEKGRFNEAAQHQQEAERLESQNRHAR